MKLRSLACVGAMLWMATASAQPKSEREFDYVLRKTPDLSHGAQLYETCAACHARSGEGVSDGSVPVIAGQHFNVVAKQIVDFRHDKRRNVRMQHFADELHLSLSQDIADVSAYVASMKPALPLGPPPADSSGRDLYSRLCVRCHGDKGKGQGDWLVPRIGGQHALYLVSEFEIIKRDERPNLSKEHRLLIADLDAPALRSIADYLANVQP